MTAVPDRILNWLYSSLTSEYHNVNRTYSDVAQCLSHYSSLSPRTDVYTFENGAPALLLLLSGTLPVSFRGNTYRFPIQLWIPHAYPREPPIAYIKPTQGMVVRPGQHVSAEGRIYHPYLAHWGNYTDRSNIIELLDILRDIFAKEPPVVSKQQSGQQQRQSGPSLAQTPVPPLRPPLPEELRPPAVSPQERTTSDYRQLSSRPPPPPPKPREVSAVQTVGNPDGHRSDAPPLPPSLPPKPDSQHQPRLGQDDSATYSPQLGQEYIPQRISELRSGREPLPLPFPPTGQYNVRTNIVGPTSSMSPQQFTQKTFNNNNYGQIPLPFPHFVDQRGPHGPQLPNNRVPPQDASLQPPLPQPCPTYLRPPPQTQSAAAQTQPKPAQKTIDILSSPLDIPLPTQSSNDTPLPAPPIPPNPEKDALLAAISQALLPRIRATLLQHTTTISSLQSQHSALLAAQASMQAEIDALNQLDATLTSNERILHEAMREADKVMERARERKVPDIDEVLVAPTVVGEQLYKVVADERGIADAIFLLGKAVDKGRIGADVFVRQTRALAREQFLKKALIKKISKGMGLIEDERR